MEIIDAMSWYVIEVQYGKWRSLSRCLSMSLRFNMVNGDNCRKVLVCHLGSIRLMKIIIAMSWYVIEVQYG